MRCRETSMFLGALLAGAVLLPGAAAAQHSRGGCALPLPTPLELTLPDRDYIILVRSWPAGAATTAAAAALPAGPCRAPIIRDTALQLDPWLGSSDAHAGFFRMRPLPPALLARLRTPGAEAVTRPRPAMPPKKTAAAGAPAPPA